MKTAEEGIGIGLFGSHDTLPAAHLQRVNGPDRDS